MKTTPPKLGIHLPPAKAAVYIKETHRILCRKSVPLKTLQTLIGKQRHASIILPAAHGFFTPMNAAMRGAIKVVGLGAALDIRAALEDSISIIRLLGSRPTHLRELVVDMPQYVGYHDAAAEGTGRVWFSLSNVMPPVVWWVAFPSDIAKDVISIDNPSGSITNSDLELAAEVIAIGVILGIAPVIRHQPIGMLCDNTPTVRWIKKMASKSQSPTAGRLLRGLAFMLYCCHAGRLTTVHVQGKDNIMADIASRPSKEWQLAMVPPWLKSNVLKTLRGRRLDLQQSTGPSGTGTGLRGSGIAGFSQAADKCQKGRPTMSRHAPHLCCRRVRRSVRLRPSDPSSVSCCRSPCRHPKICFGRTC
jgi:hypothetical protein